MGMEKKNKFGKDIFYENPVEGMNCKLMGQGKKLFLKNYEYDSSQQKKWDKNQKTLG